MSNKHKKENKYILEANIKKKASIYTDTNTISIQKKTNIFFPAVSNKQKKKIMLLYKIF